MFLKKNVLSRFIIWLFLIRYCFGSKNKYEINENNLKYYDETLPMELSLTNDNKDNLLLPFNTTRTPGSKEHSSIQNFIQDFYQKKMKNKYNKEWNLHIDNFSENGYNFTNIIYTMNPTVDRFIVLAAHYDSKLLPEGFIGGMDSAVPCAILMYVSKFIDQLYYTDKLNINHDIGIKIVFFDGEEAFREWSSTDSLYGSRHLAKMWTESGIITQIETFVLLDLIGSKGNYSIPSYYRKGHRYYRQLNDIEDAYLRSTYGLETKLHKELNKNERQFLSINQIIIDDDHSPFWHQGVPILHLIPNPFPNNWHTLEDDFQHLDQGSINKWAILMCEYLYVSLTLS